MCETKNLSDLEVLDKLRDEMYDKLINEMEKPRVGDLLRVIEMKQKLAVKGKAEQKFWEMINRISSEERKKTKIKKGNGRKKAA